MNSASTATFTTPWVSPTVLARVPEGMTSQSIHPKGAATKPPTSPATVIQRDRRHRVIVGHDVGNVEEDRRAEEAKGENYQLLMDGMTEDLCATIHRSLLGCR
jgi:hypothetical protein